MKLKLTLFFAAISSSVFAADLASLSVDASSPSVVRVSAPANAFNSTSSIYLVWDSSDCGSEFDAWPASNRIKYDGAVSSSAATYEFADLSAIPAGSVVRAFGFVGAEILNGYVTMYNGKYLNTEVLSSVTYGLTAKFNIHNYAETWASLIGGAWEDFNIGRGDGGNGYLYMRYRGDFYNNFIQSNKMRSNNVDDAYTHVLTIANQTVYFDGVSKKTGLAEGAIGKSAFAPILLGNSFNKTDGNEPYLMGSKYVNASWFYVTLNGQDGTVLAHFVPAKCGSTPAFYETVSGKVFYPKGGGGSWCSGSTTGVVPDAMISAVSSPFSVGVHAYWTGGGDRANVNDAANWVATNNLGEAVASAAPDTDTIVHIAGNTTFNLSAGQSLSYRTIDFGNVSLDADCDWRGLSGSSTAAWTNSIVFYDYIDVHRSFVNTGFKPNNNTRVVMDVDVKARDEYWFGAWNSAYNKGAYAAGNDASGIYLGFGNAGGTGNGGLVLPTRHEISYSGGVLSVDGVQKQTCSFGSAFQVNYPLYLFCQNRQGTATWRTGNSGAALPMRCYSCQIYDNGTLVRDFVPASVDSMVSLYDKVEKKFYPKGNSYDTLGGAITNTLTFASYAVAANPAPGGLIDLAGHSLVLGSNEESVSVTDSLGGGELVFDGATLNGGVVAGGAAKVVLMENCASGAGAFAMGAGTTLSLPQVGIVSLGGNLTLASGAKLAFKLDHGSETTLSLASAPNLPDSGTVVVEFEEGSAFAPDKTYTLISGGNFQASDKGKFALPQGDRGKLDVDASGNLVYIAPKYFLIKVR